MILIPVKGFQAAKQRLAAVLTPQERSSLARTMLEDVLKALAQCSNCLPASLITSDAEAERVATRFGLSTISDDGASSETRAVAIATRTCTDRGIAQVLVIPADIPLIQGSEIRSVLDALPRSPDSPGVVLVPAHDGRGTNAALLRPPGLFELRFGNDSFEPHLRTAQESTASWRVLRLPGIGLDVDNPADVGQLLDAETRTESQKLLRAWNVPDRLQLHADSGGRARRMTK